MVKDTQVRRLFKLIQREKTFAIAASKAGMDEKTARKYRELGKLPGEVRKDRTWRTRTDPFSGVWDEVKEMLSVNPGLEAKTLFEYLQRKSPGRFEDGQLRTLQRRIKAWRVLEGPPKQVIFPQQHYPGQLGQSDFTHMDSLGILIGGQTFNHLIYHFVLTYSNWETGTICFSESFESLSEGLQNAFWELGGVPKAHQTDRLTAAVRKTDHPEEFTQRYQSLLDHYKLEGRKSNAASPHELGDAEQRHHRFKRALDQALLLRGNRNFENREEYALFLRNLFKQLNSGRQKRFAEELSVLRRLPMRRLDTCKKMRVKVGPSSTIRINHNVYSVDSRLIGEWIEARLYMEHVEIWYGQKRIEVLSRIRGEGKSAINYRHIIDSLVRKPGAFENYRYREDLFPSSRFRIAYDELRKRHVPRVASKEYLKILHLAAKESEAAVDDALRVIIDRNQEITFTRVLEMAISKQNLPQVIDFDVPAVDLSTYDDLLTVTEVAPC